MQFPKNGHKFPGLRDHLFQETTFTASHERSFNGFIGEDFDFSSNFLKNILQQYSFVIECYRMSFIDTVLINFIGSVGKRETLFLHKIYRCLKKFKALTLYEPCYEKTCFLHVQKQRRRSAVQ